MRCAILCMFGVMFAAGCRQQAATDDLPDRLNGPATTLNTSDHATFPEAVPTAAPAIELGTITLTPPPGWDRKPASSSFVVAEFALLRAEGDEADARLTISTAGGSVEANLERWRGQFVPEPKADSQQDVEVAGLNVTIIDMAGDFNDQRGPFAPGERRPDYRMIGAVIPAAGQLHFIKATGPEKTVALHADTIHQFIRSVRPIR